MEGGKYLSNDLIKNSLDCSNLQELGDLGYNSIGNGPKSVDKIGVGKQRYIWRVEQKEE
jgi:hypothetical protein